MDIREQNIQCTRQSTIFINSKITNQNIHGNAIMVSKIKVNS